MRKSFLLIIGTVFAVNTAYAMDSVQKKYKSKIKLINKRHQSEMDKIRSMMIKSYNNLLKKKLKMGDTKNVDTIKAQIERLKSGGDLMGTVSQENIGDSNRVKASVPSDAKEYNGNYYKLFIDETGWVSAKKKCIDHGGHLLYINTPAERAFITKMLKQKCVWIGARYSNGGFEWDDGEKVSNIILGQIMKHYKKNKKRKYAAFSRFGDINARASSGLDKKFEVKRIEGYICEWEAQ